MNRRGHAGKVDASHTAHIDALRAIGVAVRSLAMVGDGMPDAICCWPSVPDTLWLVEFKEPGEKLTPAQKDFHSTFRWRVHVSFEPQQSVEIAMHYRKNAKSWRAA